MRLFVREQAPLAAVYAAQLALTALVYWLDGYRNVENALYAALLSGALFAGYLTYRYVTHRRFYQLLESGGEREAELGDPSSSPLPEHLQRLLRLQLRRSRTELQQVRQTIDAHIQFINQWVHQMKTPLAIVHLIVQREDDARFQAIGDETDRLQKGLDMVLYTARLDAFEQDMHVETLELAELARAAASQQKRLFIRNRVFPSIDVPAGIRVATDEKWLIFALTQLLTNAVKYTPKTKEPARRVVYVRGAMEDGGAMLEVRDRGIGIPDSDLPRVFNPYFTGENGRTVQEATGMGLYLVKQICDKLGHRIEIESEVGTGTVVRIRF
ncbi:sensor histidine kinase [Paenibacillus sp. IB182496]|uniref:histidine kinase n=1 Tax=Paenibacillus sabuli TaxID=2772509 RepID=A0A927GT50_9BACL|nr:sensor histidine kinase [Paenibacillus sabuli]MBD2846720.1 sensor histidine kinase [Paenibacillus sabuli]